MTALLIPRPQNLTGKEAGTQVPLTNGMLTLVILLRMAQLVILLLFIILFILFSVFFLFLQLLVSSVSWYCIAFDSVKIGLVFYIHTYTHAHTHTHTYACTHHPFIYPYAVPHVEGVVQAKNLCCIFCFL